MYVICTLLQASKHLHCVFYLCLSFCTREEERGRWLVFESAGPYTVRGDTLKWEMKWYQAKTTPGFRPAFGRKKEVCQAWSCTTPTVEQVWEICQGGFDSLIKTRGIPRWVCPRGVAMMIANRLKASSTRIWVLLKTLGVFFLCVFGLPS